MKNIKKIKVILLAGSMTLLLTISGIWAFFNATSSIDNRFVTASSEMSIIEVFDKFDKWLPGEQKKKEVSFENSGTADMLFRFRVDVSFEGSDEQVPDGMVTYGWNKEYLENNFTREDVVEAGKAVTYYYYNKVFNKNEKTEDVLKYVQFADEISNSNQELQVNVTVTGEMLQVNESAAQEEGWPSYKKTGNVIEWVMKGN